MPLTLSPSWSPRLCVSVHNLLRGESASTRECAWHWTNWCLTRSNIRPSDSNIPLRIYAAERVVGRTRSLCRPHHDVCMWYAPRLHAPGECLGTQVMKYLCLTLVYYLAFEFAGFSLPLFVVGRGIDAREPDLTRTCMVVLQVALKLLE